MSTSDTTEQRPDGVKRNAGDVIVFTRRALRYVPSGLRAQSI